MHKQRLKEALDDTATREGKRLSFAIIVLIIFSLITFSIETLPNLSPSTLEFLFWAEIVVVMIFSVEYAARVWLADNRWRFVFSFYGLIDLLAILPFYLSAGLVDLRSVRAFRLLRLLRLLKLSRYALAMNRISRAFSLIREELIIFSFLALLTIYIAAVGIYYFESAAQPRVFISIFDSLWWAVATLTTVGYGDVYPVTTGGKVFTFLVLMVGLGVVAVPTGLFASALSQARKTEVDSDIR